MSPTDLPIHAERHMRIVCVGAGASGLCLAYKLQRSFTNISLTVFEKNPDVSGTWYENRYPGYVFPAGFLVIESSSGDFRRSYAPESFDSNQLMLIQGGM